MGGNSEDSAEEDVQGPGTEEVKHKKTYLEDRKTDNPTVKREAMMHFLSSMGHNISKSINKESNEAKLGNKPSRAKKKMQILHPGGLTWSILLQKISYNHHCHLEGGKLDWLPNLKLRNMTELHGSEKSVPAVWRVSTPCHQWCNARVVTPSHTPRLLVLAHAKAPLKTFIAKFVNPAPKPTQSPTPSL